MKKFICAAVFVAVGFCSVVSFGGCKTGAAYVDFTLSEDGTYYIVSGVSGDKRGLTSYTVPAEYSAEEGGELLPVKEIGDAAFLQCYDLMQVTLPDTIEKISARAFAYCGFSQFTIPDSVSYIGYGAFGACENLTEITVPESVTTLEALAFFGCTSLEKAYVKGDVAVLEHQVFYNTSYTQGAETYTNTALKSVYLSASIKKIRGSALAGNFIENIYFAGSMEQWNEVYFFDMVEDEDNPGEYEESRLEKSEVIGASVTVHCNWEF